MERKISTKHNQNPDFLFELTPDDDKTSDLELDTSLYQVDNVDKTIDEHALGIIAEKNKQRDLNDLNSALTSMGYTKLKGLENKDLITQLIEDNLKLNSKVNSLTVEKQTLETQYNQQTQTANKTTKLKVANMDFKATGNEIYDTEQVKLSNLILELQEEKAEMLSYIEELHENFEKELYKVAELDNLNKSLHQEIIKNSSMVKALKGTFIQPLYDFINGGSDDGEKENIEKKTKEYISLIESIEEIDMVKLIAKKTIINISKYKKENANLTESLDAMKKNYTQLKLENIEKAKQETLYIVKIRELKNRNKNINESLKNVMANMKNYKRVLKNSKEQISRTDMLLQAMEIKLNLRTKKILCSFGVVCESVLLTIHSMGARNYNTMKRVQNRMSQIKEVTNKIISNRGQKSNVNVNKYMRDRERKNRKILGLPIYYGLNNFDYSFPSYKETDMIRNISDDVVSFVNAISNDPN